MSPLPAPKSEWPPAAVAQQYARMPLTGAWYAGDPSQLASVSSQSIIERGGNVGTTVNPAGTPVRRVGDTPRGNLWGTPVDDNGMDYRRHLPVPEDVSRMIAELLFSEGLQITVEGEVFPESDTERAGQPTEDTARTQAWLEESLALIGFKDMLLAAAEIASPLGWSALRIVFDRENGAIRDRPMIVRADADQAIPIYSWGQLTGVMFWSTVLTDSKAVYRHVELHERGSVWHALYKGSADNLGDRIPLDQNRVTAALANVVDAEGRVVIDPLERRTAISVPNMLPDPMNRRSAAGRSDYTPALIDLFDAIDRLYSQMMEEVEDARALLLLADSMLRDNGEGRGKSFNRQQRLFRKLRVPPSEKEGTSLPIEQVQFNMRIGEYLAGLDWLIDQAMKAAGLNPQTMGDADGVVQTATEYSGKNKRSMSTRDKKASYWAPLLSELLTTYLAVAVQEFQVEHDGGRVLALPVKVQFPEAVQPTERELAETARTMKDSGGASIRTLVKTMHPEWTSRQVQVEVDDILAQSSVIDPVSFGAAGSGVGPGDGI